MNLKRLKLRFLLHNYYGVQYNSKITSVFNPNPLANKLFKTLNLESDDSWQATLTTDIQLTGFIDSSYFEKKEASWFAFIRNNGATGASTTEAEWELRSLNGIGKSISTSGTAASYEIGFALTSDIGSIVSVGDFLYYSLPPSYSAPVFAGVVTSINVDLPNSINKLVIDSTTQPGTTNPIPIQDAFILYIKNPIAESHGVLGHYCIFDLENASTTATELFAVESDIMKSYP